MIYAKKIVERHNVIVDAVIHAPHTRGGSDERNYHAHILFTSRQLDKDTGEFSKNKFRDFNKRNHPKRLQLGVKTLPILQITT